MASRALLFLIGLATVVPFAAGCGSSTATTSVGPTPVRCQVQLNAPNPTFTAGGGTGQLTVNAARECQWAAAAQADWITLAQASGQGEGALQYTVRANPVPTPRRGSIVVEGQTVEVAQEAAPCTFDLDRREDDQPAAGGTGAIAVRTHAVCGWTASSDAPWLTILEGREGTGPASVRYSTAPNPGPARTARLTIAGHTVDIRQAAAGAPAPGPAPVPDPGAPPPAAPCTFDLAPREATAPAGATTGTVGVTASRADCTWTATSSARWLTITSGAAGTGDGRVGWAAEANTSNDERTASITAGGATFVLRQAGASQPAPPPAGDPPPPQECRYELTPASADVGATGGPGAVAVRAGEGCAWTASSGVEWITITAGGSGTGPGDVRYTVAANASSSARTGTLTVAGQAFTVQQAGAPAAPAEVTVRGEVSDLRGSCPGISFVVDRTRVTGADTTEYHRGNCRQVANGQAVQVTGVRQPDGSVAASHVEILRSGQNVDEDGQ